MLRVSYLLVHYSYMFVYIYINLLSNAWYYLSHIEQRKKERRDVCSDMLMMHRPQRALFSPENDLLGSRHSTVHISHVSEDTIKESHNYKRKGVFEEHAENDHVHKKKKTMCMPMYIASSIFTVKAESRGSDGTL